MKILTAKKMKKAKIGSTFPISKIKDKIGIVAYIDDGKIHYQAGLKLVSKDQIVMTDKSLKTDEAYWFDKKLDDGNSKKGRVVAAEKYLLNITENDKCVKVSNYAKSNAQGFCQLRITIE